MRIEIFKYFIVSISTLFPIILVTRVHSQSVIIDITDTDKEILNPPSNHSKRLDLTQYPGETCLRECVAGENRVCYFKFVLEHYHAMGPACGACAIGVEEDCNHPQCITGDGTEKGVMSINRQIPGPTIHVCKDDLIVVDVKNNAHGTAATLHWHGLHMKETPYMDGVPFVTQCPIEFSTTFRYAFQATEPGTQFYHSHSGHHKANGQYGALIIREPPGDDANFNEYDHDLPEHLIVISDWMHNYAEMFVPGLPTRYPGISPDSVLINGRGTYINPRTYEHLNCTVTKFYVEQGKKYRFRVVNSASHACPFELQIEKHRLMILSTDSYNVHPKPFDHLVTNSGERYDFILDANNVEGDYWIRVRGIGSCKARPIESYALLRYISNDADKDNSRATPPIPPYEDSPPTGIYLNHPNATCYEDTDDHCITELQSHEVDNDLRFALPDHKFFLGFNNYIVKSNDIFNEKGDYHHFMNIFWNVSLVGAINGKSLVFPSFPPLTQPEEIDENLFCDDESKPKSCDGQFICPCIHRIKIPLNSIVELVIVDETASIGRVHHPFHLHGFKLMVVGLGQHPFGIPMTVPIARDLERRRALPRDGFNPNPPFKDTVSIPSRGFAVVRFKANNPGFWLMHCHYEWHLAVGMGLILQVGEIEDMVSAPKAFPKCGNFLPDISEDDVSFLK